MFKRTLCAIIGTFMLASVSIAANQDKHLEDCLTTANSNPNAVQIISDGDSYNVRVIPETGKDYSIKVDKNFRPVSFESGYDMDFMTFKPSYSLNSIPADLKSYVGDIVNQLVKMRRDRLKNSIFKYQELVKGNSDGEDVGIKHKCHCVVNLKSEDNGEYYVADTDGDGKVDLYVGEDSVSVSDPRVNQKPSFLSNVYYDSDGHMQFVGGDGSRIAGGHIEIITPNDKWAQDLIENLPESNSIARDELERKFGEFKGLYKAVSGWCKGYTK